MASPELFRRLGLLVDEEFLDAPARESIVLEMRSATAEYAEVYTAEGRAQLEEGVRLRQRQARKVKPPNSVRSLVGGRLEQLGPQLEQKFDVSVQGFEPPQFLVYDR